MELIYEISVVRHDGHEPRLRARAIFPEAVRDSVNPPPKGPETEHSYAFLGCYEELRELLRWDMSRLDGYRFRMRVTNGVRGPTKSEIAGLERTIESMDS